MIEKYFLQLEHIIQQFSNIRSLTLKKKIYNTRQGYITGSVIFENGYRLDFTEVRNTDLKSKIKYRYQYMNELMEQIFRYDNAPHHSNINTFPHHKHEKEEIKESGEPTLSDVLTEIAGIQRK
ncbi:putative Genome sequencing data, contig C327 [Desulfamplus magnetovallimortis]|uniref:Uncharacterized protein n=2 Tax=Desulfobacterales TaxID=213118 RepID=A0A975BC09_9BACT|nr:MULTISPECIES: DUF6516 family protein [Desulfobacterales]QTA82642.1 Uncharacterized protein dnl_50220 [Desulfonema limicola]SLM28485.1 putative Genome sequencing data, contig C327 [Desulfamplus magnetovallimortis]